MNRSAHYCIRIRDHLNAEWSDWFERLDIESHEDGTTTLSGMVADQAALYGLLDKLRDLGLELISVNRLVHGRMAPVALHWPRVRHPKQGGITMEPKIESRAFALIGAKQNITEGDPAFADKMQAAWSSLSDRLQEIGDVVEPPVRVAYWFDDQDGYAFLAAIPVRSLERVPDGLVGMVLPESKYAVFAERAHGTVAGPEGYAYQIWLPRSGYVLNEEVGGDLEIYHKGLDAAEWEIWIPIR